MHISFPFARDKWAGTATIRPSRDTSAPQPVSETQKKKLELDDVESAFKLLYESKVRRRFQWHLGTSSVYPDLPDGASCQLAALISLLDFHFDSNPHAEILRFSATGIIDRFAVSSVLPETFSAKLLACKSANDDVLLVPSTNMSQVLKDPRSEALLDGATVMPLEEFDQWLNSTMPKKPEKLIIVPIRDHSNELASIISILFPNAQSVSSRMAHLHSGARPPPWVGASVRPGRVVRLSTGTTSPNNPSLHRRGWAMALALLTVAAIGLAVVWSVRGRRASRTVGMTMLLPNPYQESDSPLRSNEGLLLDWTGNQPVAVVATNYSKPWVLDAVDLRVFYDGSDEKRELSMAFIDNLGHPATLSVTVDRLRWVKVTVDKETLRVAGFDRSAISTFAMKVENIRHGETGSFIVTGINTAPILPRRIVPKLPASYFNACDAKRFSGAVNVSPELRAQAKRGESLYIAAFLNPDASDCPLALHLPELGQEVLFPIPYKVDSDLPGIAGGVIVRAALKIGDHFLVGEAAESPCQPVFVRLNSVVSAVPTWLQGKGIPSIEAAPKSVLVTSSPQYLQESCDLGEASACTLIGLRYFDGVGVPYDRAHATTLWDKACGMGDLDGCNARGKAYAEGTTGERSLPRAIGLFRKACAGGNRSACGNLASALETGSEGSQSVKDSPSLFQLACANGNPFACVRLADMYRTGQQVDRDTQRAISLLQTECDKSFAEACARLADIYMAHEVSFPGWEGLAEDVRRACGGGIAQACYVIGLLYDYGKGVERNFRKAEGAYDAACEAGVMHSCAVLGEFYAEGRFGIPPDERRGAKLAQRACDEGLVASCASHALILRSLPGESPSIAERDARRACDANVALGCRVLGELALGSGVEEQSLKKAAGYFAAACKLGEQGSCAWMTNHENPLLLAKPVDFSRLNWLRSIESDAAAALDSSQCR